MKSKIFVVISSLLSLVLVTVAAVLAGTTTLLELREHQEAVYDFKKAHNIK